MPIVQAKCTNCGASLQVDNSKEAAVCPYCDTAYIVEKAINNYHITNQIQANVVNIYGGQQQDFEIVAGKLVKYHGSSSEIVLPDNVSVLGKGALENCTYLERITIPKSLKAIEHLSFPLLPKKQITICVESLEQWCSIDIAYELVAPCALNLSVSGSIVSNLIIPPNIPVIKKYTFAKFRSIQSVHFAKCLAIGKGAFSGCNQLKEVFLSPMTKMIDSYAFSGCERLRNITIPDSVTSIGSRCFGGCKSLTSVSLSNNISCIPDAAFTGCSSLQQINIPSNIQKIEHDAFSNCTSLTVVNMQKGITIGNQAFWKTPFEEKKSGCYVATAVYGSYDCPQVWTLRRFRDYTLAGTWYGRLFIRVYYAVSPTLVRWFGQAQWFKNFWRKHLDKMVNNLQQNGVQSSPYQDKVW